MNEIWKDISGYEGLYQVSNLGRVKSLPRKGTRTRKERILKELTSRKYLSINLYKDGQLKTFTIHRLVAEAFIENTNNLPEVNHKDENKLNNIADNLEWCTRSYNINYKNRNKKAAEKLSLMVMQFDKQFRLIRIYDSLTEAYKETKIPYSNICKCCKRERKTAGGYFWRYLNENMAAR